MEPLIRIGMAAALDGGFPLIIHTGIETGCPANLLQDASEGVNVCSHTGRAASKPFGRQILKVFNCGDIAGKSLDGGLRIAQQDACTGETAMQPPFGVRLSKRSACLRGEGERLPRLETTPLQVAPQCNSGDSELRHA
jgi:hypothetical protein